MSLIIRIFVYLALIELVLQEHYKICLSICFLYMFFHSLIFELSLKSSLFINKKVQSKLDNLARMIQKRVEEDNAKLN